MVPNLLDILTVMTPSDILESEVEAVEKAIDFR